MFQIRDPREISFRKTSIDDQFKKIILIFFCSHIKNFIIYEIYYFSTYKIHNFLFIQISCYTDNKEIISIMIQLDMPCFMLQAFVFITFSKKINCAIQIEEILSAKSHKLLEQLGCKQYI